ncbi:phospholipase [Ktedonosporobacter rubrisoli]|uniref:Phospholipase n=1 Tax=Ktedonosporobacter rubrisoli TaxID=2509675 RepID=A0A4P6K2D0_KTERU|nr:alpha/beta fold hydrolase [Ktedonosporobacter rubrisoli]QBD81636.1 phospholipase [Ktedonosporobacter rubrisoli]
MQNAQQAYTFHRHNHPTHSLRYLLYLPKEYDEVETERWPLVLFLHGAGERGSNLDLVTRHGPPKLIKEGQKFPFIVVSPQCPYNERWITPSHLDTLAALIDEIEHNYAVDPERIYVTGISMGGFGTWSLAIANPQRFAAIVPICGGGDPSQVCAIRHLPVRAFHGAKDNVVPLKRSQEMVEALQACHGNAQLTIYPDATHDSWTQTYDSPQLYMWLLEQRRAAQHITERQ